MAVEGTAKSTRIRVTNTSPQAWADGAVSLTLSAVKAVSWYDGSDAVGTRLATVALPALAPGASVDVDVPFTVPSYASVAAPARRVILKADLVAGTLRLARAGVPTLQQVLVITSAGPTPPPTPSPTPSSSPSSSPSASPSTSPSPSPSTSPSDSAPASPASPGLANPGTDRSNPSAPPSPAASSSPASQAPAAPDTAAPTQPPPTPGPTVAPTAPPPSASVPPA